MKIFVEIKKEESIRFEVNLEDHVNPGYENKSPGEQTLELFEVIQDLKSDPELWLKEYSDSSGSDVNVRIVDIRAVD